MTLVAGVAAIRRTERRYAGLLIDSVLAIWVSSWYITAVAVFSVVQVPGRLMVQYAIPLLGMILHNTLNGISLGIDRFGTELTTKRDEVETMLALGATRWEAAKGPIRQAVRTGMIPTINSMMIIGIVSILFSHHIVGPTYRLRRVLTHLKNRDLNLRVKFRKWDYFSDLEEEMNHVISAWKEDMTTVAKEQKEALSVCHNAKGSPSIEEIEERLKSIEKVVQSYTDLT